MLLKGRIHNSPYIGVFSASNEEIAIVPNDISKEEEESIRRSMDVEIHKTLLGGSPLIGSLMVINSHGAVITDFADLEDVPFLKSDYNILFVNDKINAVGNDILAGDKAAIVHPDFDNETVKLIGEVLDVEALKMEIGGISTVGSAALVTKKALLVNPQVSDEEVEKLKSIFNLPVYIVTANFGSLYIGASMIANSKGAYLGDTSTAVEVLQIEEALGI
ncbi:MAG: translation initiation factor IF-6 [Thermoplasmata archaeon]|nr:translation initiation factor IF-6 [Thermoplasmata archaeon]